MGWLKSLLGLAACAKTAEIVNRNYKTNDSEVNEYEDRYKRAGNKTPGQLRGPPTTEAGKQYHNTIYVSGNSAGYTENKLDEFTGTGHVISESDINGFLSEENRERARLRLPTVSDKKRRELMKKYKDKSFVWRSNWE